MDGSCFHKYMEVAQETTVAEVLAESGVYTSHPETKQLSVGIFAKQVALNAIVKDGDRVEIYRPLIQDPKEKRRNKAKKS